jgi:hypothetical protein
LVTAIMFPSAEKYPCPCCGYRVNRLPPGYHEVCPICGWEDDMTQLRFAEMPGSANRVSLITAQQNFNDFGAADPRGANTDVRDPVPGEVRDVGWRPIDPGTDNIEQPSRGVRYADSYPEDTTVLYYWRATYWRRVVG